MKILKLLIIIPWIFICLSCDGGLEPHPPTYIRLEADFAGGKDAWPSPFKNPEQDSIYDFRFVAFKTYPPQDILSEILSGNAIFSEALPIFVDSLDFNLMIEEIPVNFKYLVIAWQYGENVLTEWRVAGVYTISGDITEPGEMNISKPGYYPVKIHVDWDNLPPQPF